MKTSSFCTLDVSISPDGTAVLTCSSPSDGEVRVYMSHEEIMIFLTDIGNRMVEAKVLCDSAKVQEAIKKELKRLGR